MDKTVVAVTALFAIVCSVLIVTVAYSYREKQTAMVEMVKKGADPHAVACAVDGVGSLNQQVCTALAVNSRKGN